MPTCLFAHPGAELFGSDRMLIESVRAAIDRGFDCIVSVPQEGPLVEELRTLGAVVTVAPSLVLRKALLRPRSWGRLLSDTVRGFTSAWRLLSKHSPDGVYVNTITIPLWPLVARVRRIPFISHVHEAEASGRRFVNRVLYAPHLGARRLLVNSEFSMQTIARDLPRLTRRASIVYNGVASPDHPRPPRESLDGELRALFVGRLSPRKGPDLLVEAGRVLLESGVDIRVGLLGSTFPGYEWFEDELLVSARSAGIADRVDFHGFHNDIWPFLADADVLVVPSRIDEPFGNTAVEGILALRPVIASDTSGLREAAGGYTTAQLVPPDDARALADALGRVIETWDSLRADLASNAGRALARHAPAVYRGQIGDHLESLTMHASTRG